jgi:hypothetical protein
MKARAAVCIAWAPLAWSAAAQGQSSPAPLLPVPRAGLCVTEGALEELPNRTLVVSVPKMRAYVNGPMADVAELRFAYLGPTVPQARLGSGASRRQLGIKLRAENACNLVYAMWRIEPDSALVVSVKSNAGQRSSAECTNHGYRNVKPVYSAPIPLLIPGQIHRFYVQLRNAELRAFIDGKIVWQGALGLQVATLTGPAGVRSDNARMQFTLWTDTATRTLPSPLPHCRSGADVSD